MQRFPHLWCTIRFWGPPHYEIQLKLPITRLSRALRSTQKSISCFALIHTVLLLCATNGRGIIIHVCATGFHLHWLYQRRTKRLSVHYARTNSWNSIPIGIAMFPEFDNKYLRVKNNCFHAWKSESMVLITKKPFITLSTDQNAEFQCWSTRYWLNQEEFLSVSSTLLNTKHRIPWRNHRWNVTKQLVALLS